jgi:hypothetical protein
VDEGFTACVPEDATDPTWLIVALVAFETDQVKVLLCPGAIVEGEAEKVFTTGGVIGGTTVMVTRADTLPPVFVAVSV